MIIAVKEESVFLYIKIVGKQLIFDTKLNVYILNLCLFLIISYAGFTNQFNLNYNVISVFYDPKALLEYKMGMSEEAIKTIESANVQSIQMFDKPYHPIFRF